jgi:hypothetical protein
MCRSHEPQSRCFPKRNLADRQQGVLNTSLIQLFNVSLNSAVFWVVSQCSSQRIRRFGATCSFYLHGRTVSQVRNHEKQTGSGTPCCLLLPVCYQNSKRAGGGGLWTRHVPLVSQVCTVGGTWEDRSMTSPSLATMQRVLRLQMEKTASRYIE